jgi:hypothetical protein
MEDRDSEGVSSVLEIVTINEKLLKLLTTILWCPKDYCGKYISMGCNGRNQKSIKNFGWKFF